MFVTFIYIEDVRNLYIYIEDVRNLILAAVKTVVHVYVEKSINHVHYYTTVSSISNHKLQRICSGLFWYQVV